VRDVLDYSTCVFDADGESIAQAARIPVHLNSMASCLSDILAGPLPLEEWREGDIVVTNDPYAGGQQTFHGRLRRGLQVKPPGTGARDAGFKAGQMHFDRRRCAKHRRIDFKHFTRIKKRANLS